MIKNNTQTEKCSKVCVKFANLLTNYLISKQQQVRSAIRTCSYVLSLHSFAPYFVKVLRRMLGLSVVTATYYTIRVH